MADRLGVKPAPAYDNVMKIGLRILPVAALLASCGTGVQQSALQRVPARDFPVLGRVTMVSVVGTDASKPFVKISDQRKISQIIAFVDSRRKSWETPAFGIPVPTVTAEFFNGSEFQGSFGAGRDFFETQREGVFCSREASPNDLRHFFDLLGLNNQSSGATFR
jgi:hypothetical protein